MNRIHGDLEAQVLHERNVEHEHDIETTAKPQEDELPLEPADEFEIEEPKPEPSFTLSTIFSPGVQLYCLSMLCGSLMKAMSKLLVERLHPFVVVFARMLLTSTLSMAVMHYKKVEYYFWGRPGIRILLFVRGFLGFFNICCTYFALMYMSLPDLAVISFLIPLTTSVAARVFLGEQYRWQQALASCVSLFGVLVIARPPWLFGAAAVAAPQGQEEIDAETAAHLIKMRSLAIMFSLFVVVTATAVMIILRKIADRAHALTSVSNYAVLSTVASLVGICFLPAESRTFPSTAKMWAIMCAMGVFGFMLQYLSSKAIQLEEATVLANFKYTQLVYATTLEFILWHDVPDWVSCLGIILILTGVITSARYKIRKGSQHRK